MVDSQIQIRVDSKTKKAAKKVFSSLGIDMTSAIKLYLNQVVITKSIPFRILTENGLTPQQEAEILKAAEDAEKGIDITDAMDIKEALDYLKKL